MTLPHERTRAVFGVREFLNRLASPYNGGIKGIRKEIREEARRLLRHYPLTVDLLRLDAWCEKTVSQEIRSKLMDDVTDVTENVKK